MKVEKTGVEVSEGFMWKYCVHRILVLFSVSLCLSFFVFFFFSIYFFLFS